MEEKDGQWTLHGATPDDPARLGSAEELIGRVEEMGFLPYFNAGVPGFSVEESTDASAWWTGDEARDPWEWRVLAARSKRVAYGKFFRGKAGFISRELFPVFANFRRKGYDFDSLWEDELASWRDKRVMDLFRGGKSYLSCDLKRLAGFVENGERNFAGTLTSLMMRAYLVTPDFAHRLNKRGLPYGWQVSVLCTPEKLFGEEHISSGCAQTPEESYRVLLVRARENCPGASEEALEKLLRP